MKSIEELKKMCEPVYLEKYDIHVMTHIGYDELLMIIDSTVNNYTNYADRIKNIDMLLLHFCTDIDIATLEETDPDILLCSGLIDEVKSIVCNRYEIEHGISYEDSLIKQLATISKNLPEIAKKAVAEAKEKEK